MEAIISDLVNRFEKGALTRRGLIQGLAMLTAAGVSPAQDTGLKGVKIDHISIQVSDLPRAIAFYEKNGYRRSGHVSDFFGMPLIEYFKKL